MRGCVRACRRGWRREVEDDAVWVGAFAAAAEDWAAPLPLAAVAAGGGGGCLLVMTVNNDYRRQVEGRRGRVGGVGFDQEHMGGVVSERSQMWIGGLER